MSFTFQGLYNASSGGSLDVQPSTEAFRMEISGVSCPVSASGSATAMRVTSLMVAGSSGFVYRYTTGLNLELPP